MGFSKLYGHSTTGTEYCAGFVDQHGMWNNGFYCPKWGGPDIQYCCGTDRHKYCCPKDTQHTQQKLPEESPSHASLMIGLAVGSFVLLMATIVLSCYFCRCCWAYKRRKRLNMMGGSVPRQLLTGSGRHGSRGHHSNYVVSYQVCPHGTLIQDYMMTSARYPPDDPPPYPGSCSGPLEEKLPLRDMEVEPSMETPEHQRSCRPLLQQSPDRDSIKTISTSSSSHLTDKLTQSYLLFPATGSDTSLGNECAAAASNPSLADEACAAIHHDHLHVDETSSTLDIDKLTDRSLVDDVLKMLKESEDADSETEEYVYYSLEKPSFCSTSSLKEEDCGTDELLQPGNADTWPMSRHVAIRKIKYMENMTHGFHLDSANSSTESLSA